ncbi:hypothetical protein [Aliikangiella coralliicola]|uniref:Uncharacterized protein n=1 Tax=Aliikangiella coralliicola TaxID=2592383 RepID=A0A545TS05_9GAMM|nr:hypothetical protein [Aliikangiella coralliicola]TQV80010.1 hypothetical protein FLL46_26750 [Aliikangiella coralliicola]
MVIDSSIDFNSPSEPGAAYFFIQREYLLTHISEMLLANRRQMRVLLTSASRHNSKVGNDKNREAGRELSDIA